MKNRNMIFDFTQCYPKRKESGARINALGLNLNKLESRPIPDRDFEFMFYFDLNVSVYSPQLLQLLGELDDACEQFHYLGSYSEGI